MLIIDVLSAYLICGVSALVGAAMLRIAATEDPQLQPALKHGGWALLVLGLGLLPAGLGAAASHTAAQFSLACGSLAGVVLMARGLGQAQGRDLGSPLTFGLIAVLALANAAALAAGRLQFGLVFAVSLTGCTTLMAWQGRGFLARPRNLVERALGLALLLTALTSFFRLGFTLIYSGPPRIDMLYVPTPLAAVLAALYGVLPIVLATLLLSLVNTRLQLQLHRRASTDELTGAMTRRALRELAPASLAQAQRGGQEAAVLMIDIDHFKAINDRHGHASGDRVLRLVAAALQAQLRPEALLARYGGEEFVVVLPVTDLPGARRASERLRLAVEDMSWDDATTRDTQVTVSVGVALVGPAESLDAALQRADEALYRAKRDGRNQVQVSLVAA